MRREPSKMRILQAACRTAAAGCPSLICRSSVKERTLAHLPFFSEGKKFHVPMYLATSFDEDVAYRLVALLMTACHDCSLTCCRFWYMAFDRGEPPVHWIIRVDPRGETSFR